MAQLRNLDEKYLDATGEVGMGAFGGGGGNFSQLAAPQGPISPGTAKLSFPPGEMGRGPQTDIGSKETPRERESGALPGSVQPRTISPPSPEGQMGAIMAPPRSHTPDILAGGAFRAPQGQQLVGNQGGTMFGKAGGLLGGGLGVPGKMSDEDPDISPLLALLSTLGG